MTITGGCLCGAVRWESSEPPIVTRVCWCRECQFIGAGSGTVNACFRTASFGVTGTTNDYWSVADSGNRMPAILLGVRDPAVQRRRGTTALDLRPRWYVRRSKRREACDDDLDIECTAMGVL